MSSGDRGLCLTINDGMNVVLHVDGKKIVLTFFTRPENGARQLQIKADREVFIHRSLCDSRCNDK